MSRTRTFIETDTSLVVCWGRGPWEELFDEYRISFGGREKVWNYWWWLPSIVNILKATKRYTLKWLKWEFYVMWILSLPPPLPKKKKEWEGSYTHHRTTFELAFGIQLWLINDSIRLDKNFLSRFWEWVGNSTNKTQALSSRLRGDTYLTTWNTTKDKQHHNRGRWLSRDTREGTVRSDWRTYWKALQKRKHGSVFKDELEFDRRRR